MPVTPTPLQKRVSPAALSSPSIQPRSSPQQPSLQQQQPQAFDAFMDALAGPSPTPVAEQSSRSMFWSGQGAGSAQGDEGDVTLDAVSRAAKREARLAQQRQKEEEEQRLVGVFACVCFCQHLTCKFSLFIAYALHSPLPPYHSAHLKTNNQLHTHRSARTDRS